MLNLRNIYRRIKAWRQRSLKRDLQNKRAHETQRAVAWFLSQAGPKRFQFGSGGHRLAGWFNTDYEPWVPEVYHLDMREALPFPDNSLDVAASEHVFEHFSYQDGTKILSELFRCLKPGGLVRMSMPDLDQYIALWDKPASQAKTAYMQAYVGIEHAGDPVTPCMTLNLAMRSFGHQFLYDRPTLSSLLARTGFMDIRFATPSNRSGLRLDDFEVRGASGNPILDHYETMIVEAQKP